MTESTLRDGFAALRRLRQQAQMARAEAREGDEERCDFCREVIPSAHRHLLEVETREIVCVCMPCSILFDKPEASLGRYRLIGQRRLALEHFELSDAQWAGLRLPVEMAFFFYSTPEERVVAYFPSPVGPTESLLRLSTWQEMEEGNPILREMVPDVEALLVNRARGANQFFLVPIDDCYRLVGLLRRNWRGINGGQEVWEVIDSFFAELQERAKPY